VVTTTGRTSRLELVDDTFLAVSAERVRSAIDAGQIQAWWPGWRLRVFMDRADLGTRWSVVGLVAGLPMTGSAEIWLEPVGDGIVLHHYLRLDVAATPRRCARAERRYVRAWKRQAFALKDRLEAGRDPGEPALGSSARVDLPTTGG